MKIKVILISIILLASMTILFVVNNNSNNKTNLETEDKMEKNEILLVINDNYLDIELENNNAVKELVEILKQKELTIFAQDYGNFEKVGNLGFNLPTSDKQIKTEAGDIVLYNGNQISLFYNSNSWSYTKLGHIKNITKEELINILGNGNITLKFKLK